MTYHSESDFGSDLIVDLPGRCQVKVEIKWRALRGRHEVLSISFTSLDAAVALEPVVLREIPLATIIRAERARLNAAVGQQKRPGASGRQARRTLSDSDLMNVADLYMEAWQQGLPVQRHVAEQRGIATSTAARQILLARRRGFISIDINPTTRKK